MSTLNKIENKIADFHKAQSLTKMWKQEGQKVVFTNGCFDLIHLGHIDYLSRAADLGNKLIIGLNSDNSVKRLGKGDLRPIKDQHTRAMVLAAFQFIDAVVVFDEDTPYRLISNLVPDVLVKGGDWKKEDIVGADVVESHGGMVLTIPYIKGCSTTNLVEKILNGKT